MNRFCYFPYSDVDITINKQSCVSMCACVCICVHVCRHICLNLYILDINLNMDTIIG